MIRLSHALIFGVVGWAAAASAAAQATSTEPALPEVVVTAQKREQSLQDVPISVAAMGEEQLSKLGVHTVLDFAGNVPNLYVNNFNGRADIVRLFIRGIGQNDVSITQDPSVALYVDGIYVGTSAGAAFESPDIERIEVLRGPQGTLYGRNATGGAVNIISRRPSTEGFDGRFEVTAGNFGYKRATGMLNAPIGSHVALRLSAVYAERDGWVENTGPGTDFGGQDRNAVRAALRWQPFDRFTADYTFDRSNFDDEPPLSYAAGGPGTGIYPLGAPFPLPGLGMVIPAVSVTYTHQPLTSARPDRVLAVRPIEPSDTDVEGHALTLEWRVADALTLRSLTGYRDVHADQVAEYEPTGTASAVLATFPGMVPVAPIGVPNSAINRSRQTIDFRTFSQELQALGEVPLSGGGNLAYVGGLYYYSDDAGIVTLQESITGPRDPNDYATIDDESYAAFADLTWTPAALDGRLHLTLGGRYSEDRRKAFRVQENSFSFAAVGGFTAADCARFASTFQALGQVCVPNGAIVGSRYAHDFSNSSVSAIVAFDLAPDVNVYGKYVTGYKSGGTSQRSANPVKFAEGFQPEEIVSYELGLKSRFLNGRMTFNTALFSMELDDYQASLQSGSTPGDRDFYSIDGNRIKGLEVEFAVALTDDLRLRVNGGLLDTEFGEPYRDVLLDTGATQRQSFIKPFSYAPERSLAVGLDYDRAISGNWTLGGNLNYTYQSEMHSSSNATDDRLLAARGLVDAGLSLTRANVGSGELMLRLWGRNLADKEYYLGNTGAFAFAGINSMVEYGEPRTYGLTVNYRFD